MLFALALTLFCAAANARAQGDDLTEDDSEGDPVKLFERGQNAHALGDEENLKTALEFYEQAIKLRPEFPEAEYQKGAALIALGRAAEGEKALRRAMELKPKWALPPASLGTLLANQKRDRDAEPLLRHALELDATNRIAMLALADLLTRAGNDKEALNLLRRVTESEDVKPSEWVARAEAERATGDPAAAMRSVTRALNIDPDFAPGHLLRADLYAAAGDSERAAIDLQAVGESAIGGARMAVQAAKIYLRIGRKDAALQTIDALNGDLKRLPEVEAVRTAIAINDDDSPAAVSALEKLLEREPRNAAVHARLGALYRLGDPKRSLEHYGKALEIEPSNAEYAAGYGAALVQARRFEEAARLLRRVVEAAPENYAAHANLATALDELKLYREALAEYNWLNRARPELPVTLFLIARAHDLLGEFNEALIFYETFLAKADPQTNRLEIDKVNLRLPSLRNQIKLGEGAKQKKKG